MSATAIQMAERVKAGLCACGCGRELPSSRSPHPPRKWYSERCRKHTLYSGECVDCGAPTYNGSMPPPDRCRTCNGRAGGERNRKAAEPHRAEVEAAWAAGLTYRQMAERFGWTGEYSRRNAISRLRARGYDLPYRRTPEQLARMSVGASERMAEARAARRTP